MEGTDRTFIEPFTTLSFLAGATESIGLGAATIIPFRHPIHLAYSVASLSWLTRRRFDLGIGAGNFQHEFDVIGQGDLDRPALMREQTLIARELWTGRSVEHHSDLYEFDDVDLKPQPLRDVPVWWGGATPASARLAVDFCDGWLPGRITFPTYEVRVAKIRELTAEAGQADDHDRRGTGDQHRDDRGGRARGAQRPRAHQERERAEVLGQAGVRRVHRDRGARRLDPRWHAGRHRRGRAALPGDRSDLLIFDFRFRFPDWLEQIETLARDVLPRVARASATRTA